MKNGMMCRALLVVVALGFAGAASGQVTVCVPGTDFVPDGQLERAELVATLTGLGFSVEDVDDPAAGTCSVAVFYPGCRSTINISWVDAGNGVVQVSDWGPDFITNTWMDVAEGSPQAVVIADGSHPITSGLPASWTGRGFWAYGVAGSEYVGWADAGPNLVRAGGNDRSLSVATSGAGRLVYIGWNVYGSVATGNDVVVLERSVLWAAGQQQVEPEAIPVLGAAGMALMALLLVSGALFLLRRR